MKKFDETDLKPCPHMRNLVSAHVDGNLSGITEWYTKEHIKGCTQCQASIPFLLSLKERLVAVSVGSAPLGEAGDTQDCALSPDRLLAVESDLLKIDSESSH